MDWKEVAKLSEREQMKAWVENWKRLGPELEQIKKRELRAMSEEEGARRAILVMNSRANSGAKTCERRASSGLVEQQRLFMRFASLPK